MAVEQNERLGFLGGGQMATALARGAVVGNILTPDLLDFCEPHAQQRHRLAEMFQGCQTTTHPNALFDACPRIVLAVKPQILKEVVGQLRPLVRPEHLIVSIAAGVSLSSLSDWLGTERLIRVMPNTPAQVLAGASALSAGRGATEADIQWTEKLMTGVGIVTRVSDAMLHGVTGLSGSGPAYVLTMIEALSDGGVAVGLSREMSIQLAAQTVLGTAKMVLESGVHPAVLREQVTSPGGTTIAGLRVLEQRGVRSAFIDAVVAATQRSQDMSG